MMELFKSMSGMILIEVTCADLSGTIQKINEPGVQILDLQVKDDLSAQFRIYRKDFRTVREITENRGDTLRIISREGLYWSIKSLLHRKILILGFAILLMTMTFVPTRVFFIQVEGNDRVSARLILEAASESGISFGATRRDVRSEKMKNTLLEKLPQLQWAGVNTYGCTAVITVRERTIQQERLKDDQLSSIVAARDGVIKSCTVTRGNGLCSVGQAVQEGQVLISGYTDCGLSICLTRAEGEIMAQTNRELTVRIPNEVDKRASQGKRTDKFSLLIGKKRINFYKGSGICDASCVKMYSEYVLTLPGGFELPVVLIKETVEPYILDEIPVDEIRASALLQEFASRYLDDQMIIGQIEQRNEQISAQKDYFCLTGEYACTEMIGRRRQEQIGEYHE